jgi:hypothetical protein
MAQQTAVEWLFNWMNSNQYFIGNDLLKAVEQAKEMEKEQILNACYQFSDYPFNKEDHLEYYKETYSK